MSFDIKKKEMIFAVCNNYKYTINIICYNTLIEQLFIEESYCVSNSLSDCCIKSFR